MKKFFNEDNQDITSSGSGTVISYGSGSDFLTSYGSGSTIQKVTVPTVPVPVPQHCLGEMEKIKYIPRSSVGGEVARFPTAAAPQSRLAGAGAGAAAAAGEEAFLLRCCTHRNIGAYEEGRKLWHTSSTWWSLSSLSAPADALRQPGSRQRTSCACCQPPVQRWGPQRRGPQRPQRPQHRCPQRR